jgi:hypothetical protein
MSGIPLGMAIFKNKRRLVEVAVWTAFLLLFSATAYVNWFLPHGPLYDTGDVVCQNDDRGPCTEQYKEDTRQLNIPKWAKFLRTSDAELLIFGLAFAGVILAKT